MFYALGLIIEWRNERPDTV